MKMNWRISPVYILPTFMSTWILASTLSVVWGCLANFAFGALWSELVKSATGIPLWETK